MSHDRAAPAAAVLLLLLMMLLIAAPPAAAQEKTTRPGAGHLLLPSVLATAGGTLAGWHAAGHVVRDEGGAVVAAAAGGTLVNAIALAVLAPDAPFGETLGGAAVAALAGVGAALVLGPIFDRHQGDPGAGLFIGFSVGQGAVAALVAGHNQRLRGRSDGAPPPR